MMLPFQNFKLTAVFLSLAFLMKVVFAGKRPFYVIGHMINSLDEIEDNLDRGANVLESDIMFFQNGSVNKIFHGSPCDCDRHCERTAVLRDYLQRVRLITDPNQPHNYYNKMVMQFLDLKLNTSGNQTVSGHDIASHVLDDLWAEDGRRKQELRVLLYLEDFDENEFFLGFMEEFRNRGKERRLKDVGFDGGTGDMEDIRAKFSALGITRNTWIGDGDINCNNAIVPDKRLRDALSIRDSGNSFIHKVYHWTIDLESRIRKSLNLGVDGIITNVPETLLKVLAEPEFEKSFRIASIDDDPFALHTGF